MAHPSRAVEDPSQPPPRAPVSLSDLDPSSPTYREDVLNLKHEGALKRSARAATAKRSRESWLWCADFTRLLADCIQKEGVLGPFKCRQQNENVRNCMKE
jgi:hypothetical protein